MRIGMVLAQTFPPDIRVKKEATALVKAGYSVAVLAKSIGDDACRDVTTYGLEVYRAVLPRQPFFAREIKAITLLEKAWLEPLERFIADFRPDVLHVHDFPMVNTVLKVAQPKGLPVIADLHENMPAAYRIWSAGLDPVRRMRDAVVRNYHLWRWHERRVLPLCARIIIVVPEAAERLIEYGIAQDKVIIVSNTEDETTFKLYGPDPDILDDYKDTWVVSYIGGVGPHRGLDTAVGALPLAVQHIPNLCLLIVGVQSERQFRILTNLIRKLSVEDHVKLLGWQPFEKVSSYIQASKICLVPHNDSEHTQTTIPHKLFQYMLAGKPVVVSDVKPLRRIVEDAQAGLVFGAGDPTSLAQALIQLYKQPELRQAMGHNGRQAAMGEYAWRHDAKRLVELYQTFDLDKTLRNN